MFLTAYPMAMLVYGSLHTTPPGEAGTFSLEGYRAMLSRANAVVLLNTIGLSLVKTGLAMMLALFLDGAILKNAPHPNAARLLMDFFLSDEVQTLYGNGGFGMVVGGLESKIAPEARAIAQAKLLGTTDPALQEEI